MKTLTNLYRLNFKNISIIIIYHFFRFVKLKIYPKPFETYELLDVLIKCNGIIKKETKGYYDIKLRTENLILRVRKKPSSDFMVFNQVFIDQGYQNLVTIYKSQYSSSNVKVVDLGANVGYTTAFLSYVFKKASFVVVEPSEENYFVLARNIKRNKIDAKLIKAGIWHRNAYLKIVRDFRDCLDWSVRIEESNDSNNLRGYTVKEILNQVQWKSIDILKIDIEGSEKQIFKTKSDLTFLKTTKCIAIEIHDEFNCREGICKILRKYGFELDQSGETTVGINKNL